jgi:transaldolase
MTLTFEDLKIKLFADGADLATMIEMAKLDHIAGLTTNPTLMRKAGITDYKFFSQQVLNEIKSKPISFEIFSEDFEDMRNQALEISSWGENVFVKIPITNSTGQSTVEVIKFLVKSHVKVNVTALFTLDQVKSVVDVLDPDIPSNISVFAGRIADTGRDPIRIMCESLKLMQGNSSCELIWASPRELLNVVQADKIGCHIITSTSDILNKLRLLGKDLTDYSLETVQMFNRDALSSGYKI